VILDALIAEWTKRVRRILTVDPAMIRANERHLIPEFAALDVLTFTEYRYACATGRELVNKNLFVGVRRIFSGFPGAPRAWRGSR